MAGSWFARSRWLALSAGYGETRMPGKWATTLRQASLPASNPVEVRLDMSRRLSLSGTAGSQ